ncbi:hypothetical protein BGZ65_007081 [Modicella reniformis]|uniref:LysM domain-containing protein n=1 Tax=Modicella reniformis TaxID=1440133 RepID=A0A9P6MB43_9FUNG|nr:hypothetical protein BGZ65_007081 [Modicella reniformis]
MKFTLSVAVLALAASQAMAVVPIPVKECTKSVVVAPHYTGCEQFATEHQITFPELLKWNTKLRTDCLNLDVGYPLCVSVTTGVCCLGENPYNATVPLELPSSTVVGAPTHTVTITTKAPTAATTVVATTSAGATTKPATTTTTTSPVPKPNAAAGSKGSMLLAAAGVVLSAVYMF